jgi:hypothetical protein
MVIRRWLLLRRLVQFDVEGLQERDPHMAVTCKRGSGGHDFSLLPVVRNDGHELLTSLDHTVAGPAAGASAEHGGKLALG